MATPPINPPPPGTNPRPTTGPGLLGNIRDEIIKNRDPLNDIKDNTKEQVNLLNKFIDALNDSNKITQSAIGQASHAQKTSNARAAAGKPQATTINNNSTFGGGGILGGLGALFGGTMLGAGKGLGAAGAGLGAFFMGLAGSEAIMAKFGGGDNIRKLMVNLAEGLSAFNTRDLIALGAVFGAGAIFGSIPFSSKTGGGIAIGAMGAGIGAFFFSLGVLDKSLAWLKTDYSNLPKLAESFSKSVNALGKMEETPAKVLGGIVGISALFGAVMPKGPKRMGGAAAGIGAIGWGIASFFLGFAALEGAMNLIAGDANNWGGLANLSKSFVEAMNALTGLDTSVLTVLGVAVTGTLFASQVKGGLGRVAKAGSGLFTLGAGIAGFFAGFAAVEGGMEFIKKVTNTTGGSIVNMVKDFGEAIKAIPTGVLTALGGLMAGSALFAMVPGGNKLLGKATLGLGMIGFGLGSFVTGFFTAGDIAQWLGADGSGFKNMLVNLGVGLAALSGLDGANLLNVGKAVGELGTGIGLLFVSDGFGKMQRSAEEAIAFVKDWTLGWFITIDGKKKTIFDVIVEMVKPFEDLDMRGIDKFNRLTLALERYKTALTGIAEIPQGVINQSVANLEADIADIGNERLNAIRAGMQNIVNSVGNIDQSTTNVSSQSQSVVAPFPESFDNDSFMKPQFSF